MRLIFSPLIAWALWVAYDKTDGMVAFICWLFAMGASIDTVFLAICVLLALVSRP